MRDRQQELLEQIRDEIRAIGDNIGENASEQQVQDALRQAEENIIRLVSTNHSGNATAPISLSEIVRLGGCVGKGIVEERELGGDVEIRVSMRSAKYLGSIELFTLRNVPPADYHLILAAIPRPKTGENYL